MAGPRRTAVLAARGAARLSRASGRGGTSLPGKVLLQLDPQALARLAEPLPALALVSATNGKTTTTACVRSILRAAGRRPVGNDEGANMAGGIAASLLAQQAATHDPAAVGLLEVDEFWLTQVATATQPTAILLGNLFRDQLDRYGELDAIAERWGALLPTLPSTTPVLCADDPLVASTAPEGREVVWFGIDDPALGKTSRDHAADGVHCTSCGVTLAYSTVYAGHTGVWSCPGCGRSRPVPSVRATDVVLAGAAPTRFRLHDGDASVAVELALPGAYNVANAVGAAALALQLGATLDDCAEGIASMQAAFGRGERVQLGTHELLLMLIKNPVGANEVLRTLSDGSGERTVLAVLNDHIADGRDVSWIWDADVEAAASSIGRIVCSGTRANELAMRWHYAGVPVDRISVVPELRAAVDAVTAGPDGEPITVLPTYTAMLELRQLLVERSAVAGAFT
ncbi:MAG: MurT ligase domain-containing protein [Solirubrobacteraceae bacterium]